MSSQIGLSKAIRNLQNIQDALDRSPDQNDYMIGVFNGIELAWALLNNKEPEYRTTKKDYSKKGNCDE